MILYTFARTKSEKVTDDRSVGVTSISNWAGGPKFPPVFLSIDSAKDWQQKITNPLYNDDLLNRAHWDQCHIVELELQSGLVTNVEKAAADLVVALNSQCEKDEWLVDERLKLLTQELARIGMLQI